jgi:hypothetical protein
VFPPGEIEFKLAPGPNWKSLCQPATLPLTTDYLPSPEQIRNDYTESFYTLTIPEDDNSGGGASRSGCSSHQELLDEMVCQRLSQDFQLVEWNPSLAGLRQWGANQRPGGGGGFKGKVAYTLSMGHRIHVLSYDEHTRQVSQWG